MSSYIISGELVYQNTGTANSRKAGLETIFNNYPTVTGSDQTLYVAGISGSGSTVTLSCLAPDQPTAEAFAADIRVEWSASPRTGGGYVGVVKLSDT